MNSIVILALFQHGYNARPSTLYHFLVGKRSSSVLIYGFIHDYLRLFSLFPELTKSSYEKQIKQLIQQGALQKVSLDEVQITEKGLLLLQESPFSFNQYKWLNTYCFGKNDQEIWRLLRFSLQVISEISYQNKQYIPIENTPFYQIQIKKWLNRFSNRQQLCQEVQADWVRLLSSLTQEEGNYLARQFFGHQLIGQTREQLLERKTRIPEETNLFHRNLLHHLFSLISHSGQKNSLNLLIQPQLRLNLNRSMLQTQDYLTKGASIEQIAVARNMKESTVKDHVIELALSGEMTSVFLFSDETQEILGNMNQKAEQWRYSEIRKKHPTLDYFDYRLYQIQQIKEGREKDGAGSISE